MNTLRVFLVLTILYFILGEGGAILIGGFLSIVFFWAFVISQS